MKTVYLTREFTGKELFNLEYSKHKSLKTAVGTVITVNDLAQLEKDDGTVVTFVITDTDVYSSISKTAGEKLRSAVENLGTPVDICLTLETSRAGRQYLDFNLA